MKESLSNNALHNPTHYRCTYREFWDGKINIIFDEYSVLRETKNGYWIVPSDYIAYFGAENLETAKKWISKDSRKRFAYPTKEEARNSCIARCRKRLQILKNQLDLVQRTLVVLDTEDSLLAGDGKIHLNASKVLLRSK